MEQFLEGMTPENIKSAIFGALALGLGILIKRIFDYTAYPVKQSFGLWGDRIRSKREKYGFVQKEPDAWRKLEAAKKGSKYSAVVMLLLLAGFQANAQRRPSFPIPEGWEVNEIPKEKNPFIKLQKSEVRTLNPGDDIQAAVNAVASGSTINLNPGRYEVGGEININKPIGIFGLGDVVIVGPSNYGGSTSPYAENKPIIRVNANSVVLQGFELDGRGRATSQGISVNGASNLRIQDLVIRDFKTMGLWLINVDGFLVQDVQIFDSGIGSSSYAGGACSASNIYNGKFARFEVFEGEHEGGSRNGNAFKAMGVSGGVWQKIEVVDSRFYVADFGTWFGGLAPNISVEIASGNVAFEVKFERCYFNNNTSMVVDNGGRVSPYSVAFIGCHWDTRSAYCLELSMDDMLIQNSFAQGSGFAANFDHNSQIEGLVFVNNVIVSTAHWSASINGIKNGYNGAVFTNNTFVNNSGSTLGILGAKDNAFHENVTITKNAFIGSYSLYAGAASGSGINYTDNTENPSIVGGGDQPFPYYGITSPSGYGAVESQGGTPIDPDPIDTPLVVKKYDSVFVDAGGEPSTFFEGGRTGGGQGFGEGIFNTELWGDFQASIPLNSDTATFRLFFQEIYWGEGGQSGSGGEGTRIFHVDAEGQRIIENLDLYKESKNDTLSKTFVVSIPDSILNLSFITVSDAAKVSGIQAWAGNRNSGVVDPDPIEPPVDSCDLDSVWIEYYEKFEKQTGTKKEERVITIDVPVYQVDSVLIRKKVKVIKE